MTKLVILLVLLFGSASSHAQSADAYAGLWEGYAGEWRHVSRQLIELAQATPQEKFSWRPAPGVRSTSEIYMHIALSNFYLLSITGPKLPADMNRDDLEKTVTNKAEVIGWLQRSLDAVAAAHARQTSTDLKRSVTIEGKQVTVEGMYLRLIVHDNEHMGQLIAYARMNGIVPPWSKTAASLGGR